MTDNKFYSLREAARRIGFTATWLCKLLKQGRATATGRVGNHWLFTDEDVQRIRDNRQRMPKAGRPKGE